VKQEFKQVGRFGQLGRLFLQRILHAIVKELVARFRWALNLLTLSALLELQGVSILQTQTWYLSFLQAFLGRDDHQGEVLLAEKERLQQLIEGVSIGRQ
jgi:hypothetical protein